MFVLDNGGYIGEGGHQRYMAEVRERSTERLVYLTQLASWQMLARKMAHEVKNSLTPIRLTVEEMIARQSEADLSEEPGGRLAQGVDVPTTVLVRAAGRQDAKVEQKELDCLAHLLAGSSQDYAGFARISVAVVVSLEE